MTLDLTKYGEPLNTKSKGLDLSKYGTNIGDNDTPPVEQKDGIFKGIYKSLFSPVVNLIARPGQAVQSALGKEVSTGKFLGLDITEPKTFKDTLRDVGRGLETVSLGVGGSGSAQVIKEGLKGTIKQGLKEGLKYGAVSGALGSGGLSIEEGNDAGQVLEDTLVGGAIGGVTGGALGGAIPAVTGSLRKFSQEGVRDELGNVYRQTASKYIKPQAIIDRAETVSKTDPIGVLQMYGGKTLPEMTNGSASTIEQQQFLKSKIKELSELRNEDLFLDDTRVEIPSYKKYANELLESQNWSESKKSLVRKDLNKIIDDIDVAYTNSPKNKGGIELTELTTIKSEQTGLSKSYNNTAPKFDYDAHALAGKAARDIVELSTESETVKDLNKLIQSHYDAIDFLDSLNGKKVHGGALSKTLMKLGGDIVGSVAGSTVGHPIIGAIGGRVVATKISDIVQNRFITNPIKKLLIENLKQQSPKEVNAVLKVLENKYKDIFDELGLNYKSPPKNTKLNNSNTTATPITTNSNSIIKSVPQKQGLLNRVVDKYKSLPNKEGGSILATQAFKNTGNLTTKILKDLEGKTTVSKQYILDATNRGELKQVERDITRNVLETMKGDTINVKEFADKVKSELLPLRVSGDIAKGETLARYESIVLPDDLRGNVKDYTEKIYESPIQTSAGDIHFGESPMGDEGGVENYFGHTRIEDMADNNTRRVIEVQSDLYQKGGLEREATINPKRGVDADQLQKLEKLQQYNDPTAHFRMIREEIKKASQDGKTKLQFPTGETAMKIEGLVESQKWYEAAGGDKLTPETLEVGKPIDMNDEGQVWVITNILGDGKFKAIPKDHYDSHQKMLAAIEKLPNGRYAVAGNKASSYGSKETAIESINTIMNRRSETFDISGKVDTNNPIYKFYEKDIQKYLNKFGGKKIVDNKDVSWIEVPITKEQGKSPVEAFGKIASSPLVGGALVAGIVTGGSKLAQIPSRTDFKSDTPNPTEPININPSIIEGVNIESYATDPEHEIKIQNIYDSLPEFKNAEEISKHIKLKNPNSPLTGQMIENASKKYGVSPKLLIAIMRQDSNLGTKGLGVKTRNPGNVANNDSGSTFTYPSWQEGVYGVARFLAKNKVKKQNG